MATEEEIVSLIREMTGTEENILCGIGDDAAILRTTGNILATADQLIEGVHFSREYASCTQIGQKTVAVNVSDIAAMGGIPRWALVCLGLPRKLDFADIKDLIQGIVGAASIHQIKIVGGDLSAADSMTISLTLLGDAPPTPILRSNAKAGDHIWVTGTLGDSAAGLQALKRQLGAAELIEKHLTPLPRLAEGQILAKKGLTRCMIDISDGLGSDLNRLCRESTVGARVYLDRLPVSKVLRNYAPALGQPEDRFALYGGEDYELLFTASPDLSEDIQSAFSLPVTNIGEIVPVREGVRLVDANGKTEPLQWGFDHFKEMIKQE
jgi:thiamine-monophosphate kinase